MRVTKREKKLDKKPHKVFAKGMFISVLVLFSVIFLLNQTTTDSISIDSLTSPLKIITSNEGNVITGAVVGVQGEIGIAADISSCQELNESGTYTVTSNITTNGTCFIINASNIALNGAGFSISGNSSGYGIDNSGGFDNISVQNFARINNFSNAIYANSMVNSNITNNTINNSDGRGINLLSSNNNNQLSNNTIKNSGGRGIYLGGDQNIITDNTISGSYYHGISVGQFSDYTTIENNTFFDNGIFSNSFYAIDVGDSENASISYNFINETNRRAIIASGSVRLHNLSIRNNTIVKNGNLELVFSHTAANSTFIINQDIANYSITGPGTTLTYQDSTFGRISFLEPINGSSSNLSAEIQINNNSAFVNSSSNSRLNTSANITLYGLSSHGFSIPVILKNGVGCTSDCVNLTPLSADTVIFNVTGFSNYSIGEGSNTLSSCQTINTAGPYVLTQNITANGTCFPITTSNITINGAGYSLIGNGSGMAFDASNISEFSNVVIQHFGLISNFSPSTDGTIDFYNVNNVLIFNNTIHGIIETNSAENVTISSNTISNNYSDAISALRIQFTSSNVTVKDNTFNGTMEVKFNNSLIENNSLAIDVSSFVGDGNYDVINIDGENTTIIRNEISLIDTENGIGAGISLEEVNNFTVASNNITLSGGNFLLGIIIDANVSNTTFNNNSISINKTPYSESRAIYIRSAYDVTNNLFKNNNFSAMEYSIRDDTNITAISASEYNTIYYNTSFGSINWTQANITTNTTLEIGNTLFFEDNLVGLTDNADTNLNSGSSITFYGLTSYSVAPRLLKDGVRCDNTDACNISWDNDSKILIANISSFSNYTTQNNVNSTCGVISSNTTLTSDVSSNGTCFTINASNVILDCDDYSINYSTSDTLGYGIDNSGGFDSITIQNCNIYEGNITTKSKHGIYFSGVENSTISNNTINTIGNGTNSLNLVSGIYLTSSSEGNIIQDNIFSTGSGKHSGGMLIDSSNSNNVTSNNFSSIGEQSAAILIKSSATQTINLNTILLNGTSADGINSFYGTDNNILNNTFIKPEGVAQGTIVDFFPGHRNLVANNTFNLSNTTSSTQTAIYFNSGSENNTISYNQFTGEWTKNTFITFGNGQRTVVLNNNFTHISASGATNNIINGAIGGNHTIIYNNSFGEIRWTNQTFLDDPDITISNGTFGLGRIVRISNNSAYLNTSAFSDNEINSSANITLYGLSSHGFSNPTILKDGVECTDCVNLTPLSADTVIFNVTGFSNYSIGEGSNTISSCQEISSPGTYDVTTNLSTSGGCINISENNITLNGNGYSITGAGTGVGIDIISGYGNINIQNFESISNFSQGIRRGAISGAGNNSITNNSITTMNGSLVFAIDVAGEWNISNNTIVIIGNGSDTSYGIYGVINSSTISNNIISDVSPNKITSIRLIGTGSLSNITSNNIVISSGSEDSGSTGIDIDANQSQITISNNDITMSGDDSAGIDVQGNSSTISNNTINSSGNLNSAIYLDDSNTVTENIIIVSGTDAVGIESISDNTQASLNNITAGGNSTSGIAVADGATENIIQENTISITTSGAYGINIYSEEAGNPANNSFINNNISGGFSIFDQTNASQQNTLIYNNSFGEINWTLTNISTNITLVIGNTIFLENNTIGLVDDTQALYLNGSATIKFFNLTEYLGEPNLLKNGVRCDDTDACNISWDNSNKILSASISSFSNYSTENSSGISCGDVSTDLTLTEDMSSNGTCFIISGSNIILNGAGYSLTGNASGYGILINESVENVTILDFNITNFQAGILVQNSSNITTFNNTIEIDNNVSSAGIYFFTGTNNSAIQNNSITTQGNQSHGVIALGSTNINVSGNSIIANGSDAQGILLSSANQSTFEENTITTHGEGGQGIGTVLRTKNNVIRNNIIKTTDNKAGGLNFLLGSINITVEQNTINTTGSSNSTAVNFFNAQNPTFTNNNIETSGNLSYGIIARNITIGLIQDNSISVAKADAGGIIIWESSQGIVLINNNISTAGYYSIEDISPSSTNNTLTYNNSFGEINWTLSNLTSNISLIVGEKIFLENNTVGLVDEQQALNLNGSATIKFFNLTEHFGEPNLLKNGVRCDNSSSCNISWDNSSKILTANISSFSNYSTQETNGSEESEGGDSCQYAFIANGTLSHFNESFDSGLNTSFLLDQSDNSSLWNDSTSGQISNYWEEINTNASDYENGLKSIEFYTVENMSNNDSFRVLLNVNLANSTSTFNTSNETNVNKTVSYIDVGILTEQDSGLEFEYYCRYYINTQGHSLSWYNSSSGGQAGDASVSGSSGAGNISLSIDTNIGSANCSFSDQNGASATTASIVNITSNGSIALGFRAGLSYNDATEGTVLINGTHNSTIYDFNYVDLGGSCSEDEEESESSSSSSSGGGGSSSSSSGGGGGILLTTCTESWVCSEWNVCQEGSQIRRCVDQNECQTQENKPQTKRECEETRTSEEKQIVEDKKEIPKRRNLIGMAWGLFPSKSSIIIVLIVTLAALSLLLLGYLVTHRKQKPTLAQKLPHLPQQEMKVFKAPNIIRKPKSSDDSTDDELSRINQELNNLDSLPTQRGRIITQHAHGPGEVTLLKAAIDKEIKALTQDLKRNAKMSRSLRERFIPKKKTLAQIRVEQTATQEVERISRLIYSNKQLPKPELLDIEDKLKKLREQLQE